MLQAAKKRLHGVDNVDLRRGELEALPIDDARLDAATLMLVLHHVPEPARALAEVGARAQARRPRCSSSTCCRTTARATASRWATSGSGSRTTTSAGCSARPGSNEVRIVALPPDAAIEGPGVVRRNRTTGTSTARAYDEPTCQPLRGEDDGYCD